MEPLSETLTGPSPLRPSSSPPTETPPAGSIEPTRVGGPWPLPPAPPSVPGGPPRIAGYEVLGVLGRGGMGVVFKARQPKLDRLVALKVVLARNPRPDELARFQTEAEAVGRVTHPNLVAVYEVGEWRESEGAPASPYLALEYVPGGTLEQRLNGQSLPAAAAARLVEQLARALHVVHQQGVIHRDLKPANILLTEDGSPKISDFGLARKLGESSGVTQEGAVLGTPSFMAPEQAAGHTRQVGAAADLHALGGILYQALTGHPPFAGATVWETMQKVINEAPVPPRQVNPQVPRDLETICLKCLQKGPSLRYPDARALADDLARFLAGRPIEARPAPWWERSWKWARRNPALAGLLALCVVSSAAVLFEAQVYHARLRQALGLAEDSAAESRERLVQMCVLQGSQADDAGEYAFALAWYVEALRLTAVAPAPAPDAVRMHRRRIGVAAREVAWIDQIWFHRGPARLALLAPGGRAVLTAGDAGDARLHNVATGRPAGPPIRHRAAVVAGAFLRAQSRLVLGCRDGALLLADGPTGRATPLLAKGGKPAHPAPLVTVSAAAGRFLTASADGTFHLWNGDDPPAPLASGRHPGGLLAAALSPTGEHLATAGAGGARLWRADGALAAALSHPDEVTAAAFSPDGRTLATACADGGVRLWGLDGQPALRPLWHRAAAVAVAFRPDGRRLASASDDHTAAVWSPRTGEQLVTLRHASGVNAVIFDPAGERIATASDDNTARLWWGETGERLGGDLRHGGNVGGVTFHPDGRLLTFSTDGTARLWRAVWVAPPPGGHDHPLVGAEPASTRWVSPDGRLALTAEGDHGAVLCDARTGAPVGPPMPHGSTVVYAAFSPAGDRLVTAGDDNLARLWDAAGRPLGRPMPHRGTVRLARFSPDGGLIATASTDRTVRAWSAANGLPVGPRRPVATLPERLSFAADGSALTVCLKGDRQEVFSLRPDDRPLEELLRLSQLLSGRQVDEHNGLVPLPAGRLQQLWEQRPGAR